MSLPQYYLPA